MELELVVEGMTCASCARHVERALRSVEGVRSARVEYPAGRGRVELGGEVEGSVLVGAVAGAGYTARVVGAAAPLEVSELPSPASGVRAARPAAAPAPVAPAPGAPAAGYTARIDERAPGLATAEEPVARRSPVAPSVGGGDGPDGRQPDLLVIGTGAAGMAAAIRAADLGARVGIVESHTVGGTCVNVGCIPSKNLLHAAELYHSARHGFPGVGAATPSLDWRALVSQKDELVKGLRSSKYLNVLAAYPSIHLIEGRARFVGERRVQVGDVEYRPGKVVIATGTSPWMPPVPGLDSVDALDSTSAMELEDRPDSLIVLGGSAVGLELGQMFARFGTRVVVIELLPRLLPGEDPEASEALRGFLAEEGIEIHTGVRVTEAGRDGGGVVVEAEEAGRRLEFRARRVLAATGRRANTKDLGAEAAGVELDARGFIRVDDSMRTAHPDVFAAGDVTGGPGFVYVAALAGNIAAENALTGADRRIDLSAVPRVTFTSPQVAAVGLTEAEARAAGHAVEARRLELEHLPRAAVARNTRGFVKLVADANTERLLGVHVVAPNGSELLGEATLAIRHGLTVRDLVETLHPYLTAVEALKLAAQTFTVDVSKLSCCA